VSVALARWAQRQLVSDKCALVLRTITLAVNDQHKRDGWPGPCAWPSHETIAKLSNGISVSTVKRCLSELERIGLIRIHKVWFEGHRHNAYTVDRFSSARWDRSTMSWGDFVLQEEAVLRSNGLLEGETKAAFTLRIKARLVPILREK
jgi:hypothetical protein